MADLTISAQEIPGASVYGVAQVSYSVNGVAGQDYAAAVAAASLFQANAFEAECNALSAMVRLRMEKLDDLGEVLSTLNQVVAAMPTKNQQSSDTVWDPKLSRARELMAKYGMTLTLESDGSVRRDNASYAQNDVQYALDREDNDLQQDMVSIQSLFSKRDNAFSTASQLIGKVNNASQSIIANFGG